MNTIAGFTVPTDVFYIATDAIASFNLQTGCFYTEVGALAGLFTVELKTRYM